MRSPFNHTAAPKRIYYYYPLTFYIFRVRQSAIGKNLKFKKKFPDFSKGLGFKIHLSIGVFFLGKGIFRD